MMRLVLSGIVAIVYYNLVLEMRFIPHIIATLSYDQILTLGKHKAGQNEVGVAL